MYVATDLAIISNLRYTLRFQLTPTPGSRVTYVLVHVHVQYDDTILL